MAEEKSFFLPDVENRPRRRTSFNKPDVLVPAVSTGSRGLRVDVKTHSSLIDSPSLLARFSRCVNLSVLGLGWVLLFLTIVWVIHLLEANFHFAQSVYDVLMDAPAIPEPQEKIMNPSDVQLVVLVMSARGNFDARQAIRETWARNRTEVFFVVGKEWCEIPPQFQSNYTACDLSAKFTWQYIRNEMRSHAEQEKKIQLVLEAEATKHKDVLMFGFKDSYGNLPAKTKSGLLWAAETRPNAWVLKIDDDAIALIDLIRDRLAEIDPTNFILIGETYTASPVLKVGRWAEIKFNLSKFYPRYPQGSTGYIVSPSLVKLISERRDELELYRCEDASVGIWIDQLSLTEYTTFDDDPRMKKEDGYNLERCLRESFIGRKFTYSHKFTANDIRSCYAHLSSLIQKMEGGGVTT